MMSMAVMFRRVFAGLQIVIRGIGHRSIKSNVSTANKPTPMERTRLKPFLHFDRWKKEDCISEVEMKVLKVSVSHHKGKC